MTVAQQVAAELGNDGMQFETTDGRRPLDVKQGRALQDNGSRVTWRDGVGTDTYRINYTDGSAIVVSGGAWDFAVPGSDEDDFCWDGLGHSCASALSN